MNLLQIKKSDILKRVGEKNIKNQKKHFENYKKAKEDKYGCFDGYAKDFKGANIL